MWLGFLETGARWSEMTNARWTDLSVESRTLVLRAKTTKSKKRRVIPLRQQMITALGELREHHEQIFEGKFEDSDPIFLSPEGVPWCTATRNCMRIFDRVLARAEIARVDAEGRKLDIHALRHTFGSRLARRGVGLVRVQRLMAHSDPKLTAQVYRHLDGEDLRRAVEAVSLLGLESRAAAGRAPVGSGETRSNRGEVPGQGAGGWPPSGDSQIGIGPLRRGRAGPAGRCSITELQNLCYSSLMQAKATINERGVITIPAAMRQALGLKPNDEVLIEETEQGLLIRPVLSVPLEIYTEKRIAEFASDDEAIGKLLPKKRS
jgi:AbrB family looped-hinge helix DNA binding protein